MKLILYPLLSTRSRRALTRTWSWRKKRPHEYRPRALLVKRLAAQTGLSEEAVRNRLEEERAYLLLKTSEDL